MPDLGNKAEREFTFTLHDFGMRNSLAMIEDLKSIEAEVIIESEDGRRTWDTNKNLLDLVGFIGSGGKGARYRVIIKRVTEEAYKFCKERILMYTGPKE